MREIHNSDGVRLGVATTRADLNIILPGWLELLAHTSGKPISMHPSWLLSWWDCYEGSYKPRVYWANNRMGYSLILPLMETPNGLDYNLGFMTDCCSDYLGALFCGDISCDLNIIICDMLADQRLKLISLDNIREDDPTLVLILKALSEAGLAPTMSSLISAPYISLKGSWLDYFQARSRNRRKLFRSKLRRLENVGRVVLDVCHSFDANMINQLFRMHNKRWAARRLPSTFSDQRRRCFVLRVAREFASSGNLAVFRLLVQEFKR